MDTPPPKLFDQVRRVIRTRHYSIRTEGTYVNWIRRFILFQQKRHQPRLGAAEVEARANGPQRLPVVLSQEELVRLLKQLEGTHPCCLPEWWMICSATGSG